MTEKNRSHMVAVIGRMPWGAFAKLAKVAGDMSDRNLNATVQTMKHDDTEGFIWGAAENIHALGRLA